MRLIDLVYYSAANNTDLYLGNKLSEIITVYGINYLQQLYDAFTREPNALYFALNEEGGSLVSYLLPLPTKLREIGYFLFSKKTDFFSVSEYQALYPEISGPFYSMLSVVAFVCLHTNAPGTTNTLQTLMERASGFSQDMDIDTSLALRKLQHAVYHLNGVSNLVFLREFIQNALDASEENSTVAIMLYQTKAGQPITRVCDTGMGMDLQTILQYLLIPDNSSKRSNLEFIGGRGVGFFSAFVGADIVSLKTSTGNGKTYYLKFTPVVHASVEGMKLDDVKIKCTVVDEQFKGTIVERVGRPGNTELESAKAMDATRLYGRFVDANKIKITLNGAQINEALDYIGTIEFDQIGACSIYANAECAFTAGGLFVRHIDTEYWDCVPNFMQGALRKVGVVIDFSSGIALTRERNNFHAVDKFKEFFKPLFFQLCFNTYASLLRLGRIKDDYLPDDLFKYMSQLYTSSKMCHDSQIKSDAACINEGKLIDHYQIYLNYEDSLSLLAHIKFIQYGSQILSIMDVAEYNRQCQLRLDQLPSFIRWRLEQDNVAVKNYWSFEKMFEDPSNEYEESIANMKYRSWPLSDLEKFSSAPNWIFLRDLTQKLWVSVSSTHRLDLELWFSTECPTALAFVVPGNCEVVTSADGVSRKNSRIYFNPVNWQKTLDLVFKSACYCDSDGVCYHKKGDISQLMNKLVETISHEIAHLLEGSYCGGGVRQYTHDKAFRDICGSVYATMLIENDYDALLEYAHKKIQEINKNRDETMRLPTAKDLMIMMLLNKPHYLQRARFNVTLT